MFLFCVKKKHRNAVVAACASVQCISGISVTIVLILESGDNRRIFFYAFYFGGAFFLILKVS